MNALHKKVPNAQLSFEYIGKKTFINVCNPSAAAPLVSLPIHTYDYVLISYIHNGYETREQRGFSFFLSCREQRVSIYRLRWSYRRRKKVRHTNNCIQRISLKYKDRWCVSCFMRHVPGIVMLLLTQPERIEAYVRLVLWFHKKEVRFLYKSCEIIASGTNLIPVRETKIAWIMSIVFVALKAFKWLMHSSSPLVCVCVNCMYSTKWVKAKFRIIYVTCVMLSYHYYLQFK